MAKEFASPPVDTPVGNSASVPEAEVAVAPVKKEQFKMPKGSSTFAALNRVTCDNIALTNSVKLGDALYHLALAIGRSGEEMDDMGNISKRGINKDLAAKIHEFLNKELDADLRMAPVNIGYDPTNPLFAEGEAYSIPIAAEMVMILNIDAKPPQVIEADDGDTPQPAPRH